MRAEADQAQESHRIIRDRFDAGIAIVNDVLRASSSLLAANANRPLAVVETMLVHAVRWLEPHAVGVHAVVSDDGHSETLWCSGQGRTYGTGAKRRLTGMAHGCLKLRQTGPGALCRFGPLSFSAALELGVFPLLAGLIP